MSFWIGLGDEGPWAVPKYHMIPDKCSKENLGNTLGQHWFVFQNFLMPHAALSVLALEVSAGEDICMSRTPTLPSVAEHI